MSNKNLNEMSSSGAIQGAAITGRVGTAAVYEPKKKKSISKGKKDVKNYVTAKLETKAEKTLREAIKNLIFLNRVKYHEEQAKREIQEQKIRRVIRYLLKEGDNTRDINFSTTGAASAWNFVSQIEKTTFENDFATTLKSSKEQRNAFKTIYLTGVKIYLDSLDQQYLILNPEDSPSGAQAQGLPGPAGDSGLPPPSPTGLQEADNAGIAHPSAAEAMPAASAPADTKNIQSAAVQTAISSTAKANLDKTGVNGAEAALKRDLPQIDPLYFNLTFKPVTTSTGRNTNDRQEFRFFLIGDQNKVGNIQLKFKEWEDKMPIGGQISPENTPKMDPSPLNLPSINGGATTPSPAETSPVAGLPAGL